jgi:hypothetical protein
MNNNRVVRGSRILALFASLCFAGRGQAGPPEVYRYGGLLAASVVGQESFESTKLSALERELSKSRPYPKSVLIDAFPYHFARNLLYSPRPTDVGYEGWANQYKYAMAHLKDVKAKRIIHIGDNAVLQSYDAGHFSEVVTSGTNPALLQIDGVNIRILEVEVIASTKLPGTTAMLPPSCEVFLQATPLPPLAVARKLSNQLFKALGAPSLIVHINADAWQDRS